MWVLGLNKPYFIEIKLLNFEYFVLTRFYFYSYFLFDIFL